MSLCFLNPCLSLALSNVSSRFPLLFFFLFIFLFKNEEAAAVVAPADVNGQGDQRDEEEDDGGDAMPVPQVRKSYQIFRGNCSTTYCFSPVGDTGQVSLSTVFYLSCYESFVL